ncbi:hypothetical protein FRC01_008486 [Tulasnella sp. 417]|nr:hypothetical protein FRC01_008486 [Tulasnella sp. 417]
MRICTLECSNYQQEQFLQYLKPTFVKVGWPIVYIAAYQRTKISTVSPVLVSGTLPSKAAENLHILRNMLRTQTLQYKFPYAPGNGFEFQTDIPCIVLCDGGKSGKSVFLPENDVHIRLNVDGGRVFNAYKASKDLVLPPAAKLQSFRQLVCGAMMGTSKVTPDVARYIQDDFVKERTQGASRPDTVTPQDLMLRMNLVRTLAVTHHENEVSRVAWDRVKALDLSRRARLQ